MRYSIIAVIHRLALVYEILSSVGIRQHEQPLYLVDIGAVVNAVAVSPAEAVKLPQSCVVGIQRTVR